MSNLNYLINFLLHDATINRADKVWVISDYTRSEVENRYPNRKCKSIFVGSSIDKSIYKTKEISKERKSELDGRFGLNYPFLIFVGTLEPRKNLPFLLSLMPRLSSLGFMLLIVGKKGWGKNDLKTIDEPGYPKEKIVFTGFINFSDLVDLYQIATAYVSTSLNEGFGLPQLEAMTCGCPVVSPHNSAMIEVVEGAGETVSGWNQEDWVSAILKVAKNKEFYRERGLSRTKMYNWKIVTTNWLKYIVNP
jgi:glycosyltransferase involved in cell wall biosynthesis